MQYGYLIKISNKTIYKEVQLPIDVEILKIGVDIDCDVRFYKDSFFENFELLLKKVNNVWQLTCSENVYIDAGDIRKLATKKLSHGESFAIKYQNSDSELFKIEFLYDFDNENRDYDRIINVSSLNYFTVGNNGKCSIIINSEYVVNDLIEFNRINNGLVVNIISTTYGFYHNGRIAMNGEVIRDTDFFSIANFSFYYKSGVVRTSKNVIVNGIEYFDDIKGNDYPRFNRNTRIKTVLSEDKIEILDPPAKPQKPKSNLFTRLLPSIAMIAVGAATAMSNPFMLISSGVGVITAIISVIQGKKDFKDNSAERIEKYTAYIENKKLDIAKERDYEKALLEEIYINTERELQNFSEFSSDLFDRTKDDEEFLTVRLGVGDVKAKREIDFKKQEKLEVEDDLQKKPEEISNEFEYIHFAPITCPLKESNAIGIVGEEKDRYELMKIIIIDICARQFQSDVKLFLVAEESNKQKISWLRMLPQIYNDDIGIRNIICNDESKNILFEYLYKELTIREEKKQYDNNIIIFLYDEYGFQNHPVSKFLDKAKDLGVTFIFFGDSKANIGLGCKYIIDIVDEQNAIIFDSEDKSKSSEFTYSAISDAQAYSIVNLLAPVYTEEISLEGTLTKNISLFKLLNILTVNDIDLDKNWKSSQVFKSMAAPIGVSKTGVISLDLHDKAHGPHGLVAGTTGSGKSEILQTYILSMATLFHPYEVGFVIIDFKGGGMVNQFSNLPHLLGAITNIDGKEIDRSLKSIKAELQKRQRLFAEAEVNHIDKYIRKFKSGEVTTPLPHLIIIVDEFAELKAEQPEFMKELISAARIGRSLGVHLILATQKPSGQVNEQIWSNSRFKLCLKVQSQEDSNEVLKSPLAAEIKEPGRAYLQVGNNEIFELFQSAYSGASEKTDDSNVKEFTICSLTESGKRVPVYVQKKKKSGEGSATQLDAIVNYVSNYCKSVQLAKLPNICLPSLEHKIDFVSDHASNVKGFIADIGIYDDPDNQYQGVFSIDVGNNNLMIIGSSQSGKTNMLQDIIRSISTRYTPDEATIYIIDFASMVLKNFEKLNHVGGVVCPSDDEKLKNLFKLLNTEIEERKEKLMSIGVSSFAAYKDAGLNDLPQIVLMIDNLTALKELYFQDDDELLNLCREGLTVGISIIIANSQTAGIGYKYLSNFAERIAFFCNDSNEYSSLFDHCSERIDSINGRCIVEIEKRHLECQTYLAFKGEKEIDRVKEIKAFTAETNERNKNSHARRIPLIPESLTKGFMVEQFGNYMEDNFNIVSGLDYSTVTPCVVDFSALGLLAITGREQSGKHNWVRYSVDMLNTMYPGKSKIYVVDSIGKKLSSLKQADNMQSYSMVAEDAVTYIKEIERELKTRYDALVAGNEEVLTYSELLILIIDNQDALMAICNDREALEAYKNIIGRYKNMRVAIITFIENANIPYSAPEILKNIRDQRHIMFFDDISNMKIFDVPLAMARNFKKPIETGDGYYIKDNECSKLKTAFVATK